jgi:hypothetical protein
VAPVEALVEPAAAELRSARAAPAAELQSVRAEPLLARATEAAAKAVELQRARALARQP